VSGTADRRLGGHLCFTPPLYRKSSMPPLLQTTVARTPWIIVALLGLILSAERAQAGEIASVVGIWSGQIQAMTTSKGIVEKGSHSVADGRIRIERAAACRACWLAIIANYWGWLPLHRARITDCP